MCKNLGLALLGSLAMLVGGLAWSAEPDDDEQAHQTAVARQALRDNCLICHAEEMVSTQRLTAAQWKAEVDKMVGWGAPVPKEHVQPLIDYLAREYDDRKPAPELPRLAYDELAHVSPPAVSTANRARGDTAQGAALFAKNCASCHGAGGQGADLGQNLVEKPVLFRPDAFRKVIEQGQRRMPGFQQLLSRQQTEDIRAWLQSRRFTAVSAR